MAIRFKEDIRRKVLRLEQEECDKSTSENESFPNIIEDIDCSGMVSTIMKSHADAVDAIDTIEYLIDNGFEYVLDEWMTDAKFDYYTFHNEESFCMYVEDVYNSEEFSNTSLHIDYIPKENCVKLSLFSGCNLKGQVYIDSDEGLNNEIAKKYMSKVGLRDFSKWFQPFLDDFFKWVEKTFKEEQ